MTSVQDLLARATSRVVVDGAHYFVTPLSSATDWLVRVTGDEVHRPYLVRRHGVMAAVRRRGMAT